MLYYLTGDATGEFREERWKLLPLGEALLCPGAALSTFCARAPSCPEPHRQNLVVIPTLQMKKLRREEVG